MRALGITHLLHEPSFHRPVLHEPSFSRPRVQLAYARKQAHTSQQRRRNHLITWQIKLNYGEKTIRNRKEKYDDCKMFTPPIIEEKVTMAPNIDQEIITYLFKMGKYLRKGLEKSLESCQDKVLDILGKDFRLGGGNIPKGDGCEYPLVSKMMPKSYMFSGNANARLLAERQKTILMHINPKLGDSAVNEPSEEAKDLVQ
ncbi:hypothetical protein NDU88_006454 [Pleurodeles waltl]|uniref:Uncharacterized protein n=1 Tax=Pleurodeles waltl TaxID=8319 RepID=A0AAV7MZ84_PLEWA|nr:hypothetical protein NDU88_006454 [Pleurodeles waltl]